MGGGFGMGGGMGGMYVGRRTMDAVVGGRRIEESCMYVCMCTDFGGVDPNNDPALAMALRVSYEEERARQEAAAKAAGEDVRICMYVD